MIIGDNEYRRLCCSECAVVYYFPERWCEVAKQKGKGWKCPNGHGQWFGDAEIDQIRRERDRLKQNAAMLEQEVAEAQTRANKAEAAARLLKKRAASGTCPCCKRTVGQLARHMATKHPEFVKENGSNVVEMKRA